LFIDVFVRVPAEYNKSFVSIDVASCIEKGIPVSVSAAATIGIVGSKNHVCVGRGIVEKLGPVGPLGPLTFDN
jgi:hypothetical protein